MSRRLTQIAIDGIRNHERTVIEVGQLTAFYGRNGAGKTTIDTAIALGKLGYDPATGKRLQDTRTLIPSNRHEASVALTFEGGLAIERRFGRKMETRVSPPKGEHTEDDWQRRIDEETGTFVPAFDLAAFTGLSAQKRMAWFLSNLPRSAITLTLDDWRHWLGYKDVEKPIQQAIDKVWQEKVLSEQSILDGLATALEYTREKFNEAERFRRDQVAVVESCDRAAAAATEAQPVDPEELQTLQDELSAKDRRLGELEEQIAGADAEARRQRQAAHEISVAEIRLVDAQKALTAALEAAGAYDAAADDDVAAARAGLQAAEAAAAEAVRPSDDELATAAEAFTRAERKARSQRDAVRFAAGEVASALADVVAAQNQLEQLTAHETCPTCGSTDIAGAAARVREKIPGLNETLAKKKGGVAEADARQDQLDAEVGRLQVALNLMKDRRDAAATAAALVDRARAELERATDRAEDRALRLAGGVERAERNVQRTEEELERLRGLVSSDVPDTDAAEAERDELRTRVGEIHERMRAVRAALKDAAKAEAERERADTERAKLAVREARAEALKKLYGAQQRLRADVIAKLVDPIEQAGNDILQTIDPAKRFRFLFEREGRAEMEFGFEEAGEFRAFSTASTGEGAFLAVVFVAALMEACKPPWPFLRVDNAEHLDRVAQQKLMVAIARLRKYFGNVFLYGCWPFAEVEGWDIVDVEKITGITAAAAA